MAAGDSRGGGAVVEADTDPGPMPGPMPVPIPSGLLTQLPDGHTEAAVLAAALRQLTAVTRALSRNLQLMNGRLERTLQDKEDVEELEGMLNRFLEQKDQVWADR